MPILFLFALFAHVLLVFGAGTSDHQTQTYTANHGHASLSSVPLRLSSFFSPDHSIDVFTELIQSANTSIDISTPGWNSWSGCTDGCGVAFLRKNEQFPVFQVLLNKIHAGVKVRIISNDEGNTIAPGLITPLSFLALAGANVTAFATLTFLHTKWVRVDGGRSIISSCNYDYTSFMENREAGVLLEGSGAAPLHAFLDQIYELDVARGYRWKTQSYNASDMAVIQDRAHVPVVMPKPRHYSGAYVSTVQTVDATVDDVAVIANPDDAWKVIGAALKAAQQSIEVYVYQITDSQFCGAIETAFTSGVRVKLLVSDRIDSSYDYYAAQKCYRQLYNAGLTVRKCNKYIYKYEHQKFWIIDDTKLYLSSGNMGQTDFPSTGDVFPPPGNSGWRRTNRDHTIYVNNRAFADTYKRVLDEDYKRGYDFK